MPAWILSALSLLARGGTGVRALAVGTPTRALVTGTGVGAALSGVGIPGVDLFPGDGRPRRRRRRRALTASDRADIGFITGLLGPAAGKSFALTIASRTT